MHHDESHWISEITLTKYFTICITFLLQKHKETMLVTRPTRRLRGCVFIWLLLAKAFDKEHLKRTSPHPNSVQSKVLLQIFSVSLAPKIHFTWFMCQAPRKYSKSPQLSSQGAFCMLNYVGKTGQDSADIMLRINPPASSTFQCTKHLWTNADNQLVFSVASPPANVVSA